MPDSTTNIPPEFRREYFKGELLEADAAADPIVQFEHWFNDATLAGILDANAMTLATADASGAPASRIVLLKHFDARGFMFFTNYDSRKGRELTANPRASLCLYWKELERQVRIDGTVEKTTREENDAYFHSRPAAAQIGAWASKQSDAVTSRQELDQKCAEMEQKFAGGAVPLPDYWGGYRVIPQVIEFWQGRPSRLHDRLEYRRGADGKWTMRRLSP